jgi:hypothetical protein
VAVILSTNGHEILVDDEDLPLVSQCRWSVFRPSPRNRSLYARTYTPGRMVYMHRLIAGCAKEERPDHKNGNGLDNRRGNLQVVSHRQNCANQPLLRNNTSGFKGVCWHRDSRKWRVKCAGNYLGLFSDKEEAARAYDAKLVELFGPEVRTNRSLGLLPLDDSQSPVYT